VQGKTGILRSLYVHQYPHYRTDESFKQKALSVILSAVCLPYTFDFSLSSSPSQAIFSPGSHQPRVIIASQHPPPLAPVPFQVYTSTITNDHSNTSNRHPHYDQVTTRESLQYRAHRLQMEKEQSRQDQQLPGNDYLSTDREQERRTSGDVSRTVYPNRESPYHARPLNGSGIDDDDSSEYYATFIETNNNEQQSTTNGIYREDNSSKL
jgi:hypothetical protein